MKIERKNSVKKHISVILSFCILLSAVFALYIPVGATVSNGIYGENITWEYDTDSATLTVSGSGDMADNGSAKDYPWYSFCGEIKNVCIGDGITGIGENAFWACSSLISVKMTYSVTRIGNSALPKVNELEIHCYPGSFAFDYAMDNYISYVLLSSPSELKVKSLPTKTVYPLNGNIRTAGLTLECVFKDGYTAEISDGFTVGKYDFSTPGEKEVPVSYLGKTVSFSVTVDAALMEYPESEHPYAPNSTETWTYTHNTSAEYLKITISDKTDFGTEFDSITVYDKDRNMVGCYSGTELAGETVTVPGNSFSITLTSFDSTNRNYGFSIDSIKVVDTVTGSCGKNIKWEYSISSGNLVFTGSGAMSGWNLDEYELISSISDKVKSITVSDGITSIADWAFSDFTQLTTLTVSKTVEKIGESAFRNCSALTDVYYNGTKDEWIYIIVLPGNDCLRSTAIHYGKPIVRGDVSGDGKVNVADALMLKMIIVNKLDQALYKTAADLNGDGKLNATDALTIRRIIVGKT